MKKLIFNLVSLGCLAICGIPAVHAYHGDGGAAVIGGLGLGLGTAALVTAASNRGDGGRSRRIDDIRGDLIELRNTVAEDLRMLRDAITKLDVRIRNLEGVSGGN